MSRQQRPQSGYALLWVLAVVAITQVAAMRLMGAYQLDRQRQVDLDWAGVGNEYAQALARYAACAADPAASAHPLDVGDLLEDWRTSPRIHHLRSRYRDPTTQGDWVIVRNAAGQVVGVRSTNESEVVVPQLVRAPNASPLSHPVRYRDVVFGEWVVDQSLLRALSEARFP